MLCASVKLIVLKARLNGFVDIFNGGLIILHGRAVEHCGRDCTVLTAFVVQ